MENFQFIISYSNLLDDKFICNRFNQLRTIVLCGHKMAFPRCCRVSLAVNLHTTGLGFSFLHLVFFHTAQEIISALGMFDMLNPEVDSFWDDSVSELLVNDSSNSSSCHVEYSSSFAVVVFVWHSFVNGSISLDINNVTNLVGLQISRQMFDPCFSELFREQVPRSSAFTMWIGHC